MLDKLSKSIPEKRAEILPDSISISNIADKAKQALEQGKKAFEEGKAKAKASFNKFTSGIKMPTMPTMPTMPIVNLNTATSNLPKKTV